MQPRHYLLAAVLASAALAMQKCPPNPSGLVLQCAFECCESLEGPNQGYYCCGADEKHLIDEAGVSHGRAERFVAYGTTLQVDYTMLVIGLILSIVISILLSFFCCLLCNGCWLHRRRNPQMYESVNESGFYPICCGFGIPMGTVVFSTHPPQFRDDNIYHGSSTSSLPSSRNRVRFNEDGTPKGVLKNGHQGQGQNY
uniref:Protein shisa-4 n=1 Tax=Steinernema glaseri TaxID=37863 RepID=A0A1I8AV14_9BILA